MEKGDGKVGIIAQNEKRRPNVSLGETVSIVENSGKEGYVTHSLFLNLLMKGILQMKVCAKIVKIFISRNCFICVKKIFHY